MDIYAEVTKRIIDQMEQGIIPWQKPWVASGQAISRSTGKAYSLLNQMLLGKGGEYVTFKQCQQEGGKVKKGEKASMVVFWKFIEQEDEETGEKKQVPFLRYYSVFHIDQCEGLEAKHMNSLPLTANADETAESISKYDCDEMDLHTDNYVQFVLETLAEARQHCADPLVNIEQRLDFSCYVPDGFGTGDCIIISDKTIKSPGVNEEGRTLKTAQQSQRHERKRISCPNSRKSAFKWELRVMASPFTSG